MGKEIFYLIDNPKLIALVNEIKDEAKPITALYKALGRDTTVKSLSRLQVMSAEIKLDIKELTNFKDWPRTEFEFAKYFFGMHNNRRKEMFKLNSCVVVEQRSPTSMRIKIDLDKLQAEHLYDQMQVKNPITYA